MDIGTYEAKTHFAELLEEVQAGKDYTVTKRGKPIARILPIKDGDRGRAAIVASLTAFRRSGEASFDIKGAIEEGRT